MICLVPFLLVLLVLVLVPDLPLDLIPIPSLLVFLIMTVPLIIRSPRLPVLAGPHQVVHGVVTMPRPDPLAAVQLVGIVSMLVDHLGAVSILGPLSRLPGRFAVPAFVLMVAINALRTSRPGVMVCRLVVLMVLSQPLYWLTVGTWDNLSILVTLLAVVLLVWAWRARRPFPGVLILVAFLLVSPWVEYGPFPLLLLPLVLLPSYPSFLLALSWPALQYFHQPVFFAPALVGLLLTLVLLRFPVDVPRSPRWFSRWFYPGHLAALATMV